MGGVWVVLKLFCVFGQNMRHLKQLGVAYSRKRRVTWVSAAGCSCETNSSGCGGHARHRRPHVCTTSVLPSCHYVLHAQTITVLSLLPLLLQPPGDPV